MEQSLAPGISWINLGSNPTFDTYQFMIFINLSGA